MADIAANARRANKGSAISPVALEAVRRIDAVFDIERTINGLSAEERLGVRQEQSAPLLSELEEWLRDERPRMSRRQGRRRQGSVPIRPERRVGDGTEVGNPRGLL